MNPKLFQRLLSQEFALSQNSVYESRVYIWLSRASSDNKFTLDNDLDNQNTNERQKSSVCFCIKNILMIIESIIDQ